MSKATSALLLCVLAAAHVQADTRVGCSGQPGDYEMCVGEACYQANGRTVLYRFYSSMCEDANSYTCVVGDQRDDGTYDMWPAVQLDSGGYDSCDPNGPDYQPPAATETHAEDVSVPVVDTDTSTDDWWWDTEEPEPLPPRHCSRVEGVESSSYHTLEGEGVLCVPVVVPEGATEEETVVVVTLEPANDDHDLCAWENEEAWESQELYAKCHEWRHSRLPELHCRSSLGGTDTEQVRIDTNAEGLMACIVPWQGAMGGWSLSFGETEPQAEED